MPKVGDWVIADINGDTVEGEVRHVYNDGGDCLFTFGGMRAVYVPSVGRRVNWRVAPWRVAPPPPATYTFEVELDRDEVLDIKESAYSSDPTIFFDGINFTRTAIGKKFLAAALAVDTVG